MSIFTWAPPDHRPVGAVARVEPFSLSEWPGRIAAVVYTTGCNLRCPHCHARSLRRSVTSRGRVTDAVERVKELSAVDGVAITGGEPTFWLGLPEFVEAVRAHGLPCRLFTNGTQPTALAATLAAGLQSIVMSLHDRPNGPLYAHADVPSWKLYRSIALAKCAPEHEFRVVDGSAAAAHLTDLERLVKEPITVVPDARDVVG